MDFAGARILVVDDEQSNVVLLDRMLRRAGYTHVVGLQDSRLAMRTIQEQQPDLILLDLMMPNVDGYEILSQLKQRAERGDYLPIMVLTADITPQALQRALSGGARDFLTKPFDQAELLLRVHNLLETRFLYRTLHQNLAQLESLNEQAQRDINFRDSSLSALSHDIGQPLAAIRLTTEMLQEMAKDDAQANSKALASDLQRINLASGQMASMIAEMSDMARLQMGRELVLQRRPMDLVAMARQQVAVAQRLHPKHKIRLQAETQALTGDWDEMRLNRVLSNLLSNAVKFSPKGGAVEVHVSQADGGAMLSVGDHGIGIPDADLSHVFESFFRAGNVQRIDGSGVGLASARQIVGQHGGTIAIESREWEGTTVRITLPLQ